MNLTKAQQKSDCYETLLKNCREVRRCPCESEGIFYGLCAGRRPDARNSVSGLGCSVGLVKGEWIAIDGSKFHTVSSARSIRERAALERYLEQLEQSDQQDEVVIDRSAVASALEKLRQHPEPEAGLMHTSHGLIPAYNVPAAVDAEHALIVAQQVTVQAGDNGSLQPMAEAAQAATGGPALPINVVADAGYSNGEQAEACEAKGILPHVPASRG